MSPLLKLMLSNVLPIVVHHLLSEHFHYFFAFTNSPPLPKLSSLFIE